MNWEGHNPVQKSAPHWTAGLGSGGGCGVAQSDGLLSVPYHPGTGKGDFLREMTEIRVRRAEEAPLFFAKKRVKAMLSFGRRIRGREGESVKNQRNYVQEKGI